MQENHPSTILRLSLVAAASLSLAQLAGGAAIDITFAGGGVGDTHRLHDGNPIAVDAGYQFELGSFVSGFDPAAQPTETWLANWSPVTDEFGAPLPGATADFTTQTTLFDSYPGFRSTIQLEHNDAPFFTTSQSAYIWGFDTRTDAGDADWILITDLATWKWPDTDNPSFARTWDLDNANPDDTLVGSLVNGEMTMGQVTIPSAVPEPSPSALALLAAAFITTRRRRPSTR